ncbi:hypothetical protein ACLOJK_000593 [Asimina triloba]
MVGLDSRQNGRRKALEELIDKTGGCAVIDGGFATQLERHGAAINDPLWSAVCLITNPDLIKRPSEECRRMQSLLRYDVLLFRHYR